MVQTIIQSPFPPAIVNLASGRYVVGGPGWIKVGSDFTIEDTKQLWQKPAPKASTKHQIFQVANSKKDGFYQVEVSNGWISCNCTGYGFRRTCKHVEQVKKSMATC